MKVTDKQDVEQKKQMVPSLELNRQLSSMNVYPQNISIVTFTIPTQSKLILIDWVV